MTKLIRQRDGTDEQKRDGAGPNGKKPLPLSPGAILSNKKYERSKYYFFAIFPAKYVYSLEQ